MTDVLMVISYLEKIHIGLSVYLCGNLFHKKKILFHSDNNAVVEIFNKETSTSLRIMNLVRLIVYWSLLGNFHVKVQFIPGYTNVIADYSSLKTFQRFKSLDLTADTHCSGPYEYLDHTRMVMTIWVYTYMVRPYAYGRGN